MRADVFKLCCGGFLQSHATELHQLQETIRGRKCEVHVSSIMGKCSLLMSCSA